MSFSDYNGNEISIPKIAELLDNKSNYQLFVGTDSKVFASKKTTTFATCIVLYNKGKGGKIFYKKHKCKKKMSLKQRLTDEVLQSLQVAFELHACVLDSIEIIIHIDVNSNKKHKSSFLQEELIAMVAAQGFKAIVKPEAFIATKVADLFSRK